MRGAALVEKQSKARWRLEWIHGKACSACMRRDMRDLQDATRQQGRKLTELGGFSIAFYSRPTTVRAIVPHMFLSRSAACHVIGYGGSGTISVGAHTDDKAPISSMPRPSLLRTLAGVTRPGNQRLAGGRHVMRRLQQQSLAFLPHQ